MARQNGFTPLHQKTITDTVYGMLSERIISGAFRPGERLQVNDIAKQLKVSATPVKSALALLASEGLVKINPRSGTFVTPINERALEDVLAIRKAFELLAAETAVQNAAAQDIEELSRLVSEIANAKDVIDHYHKNARFHLRLVELSGNRMLFDMYRQMHAHIQVAFVHARSETWKDRAKLEQSEHAAIVKALKSRKLDAMRQAVAKHLNRTYTQLLKEVHALAEG
jgi:DNA-binding GntR family transcriptional regulator